VRIALAPPAGVSLVPGQFVTALIEHGRGEAAVVVPFDAVQRLADREVVFVPEAQGFRARPVTIGRRAAQVLEIREGLAPAASYVAKGAFLLKAEIGKNQAADQD
jgi:membrane fusion protein, heavy metal efflux system